MFTVLEELRTISSTNDKIALLAKHKENDMLRVYLKLASDDAVRFNVKSFSYDEPSSETVCENKEAFEKFIILADRLINRVVTGAEALKEIKTTFSLFTKQQAFWFEQCIKKDLSCIKLGSRLINKVWPGLCLDFRVQLAESEDELEKFTFSGHDFIELKLNGIRTTIYMVDGKVIWIKGRSGLDIEAFEFLIPALEALSFSGVLDGEVHCDNVLEDIMSVFGFDYNKTRADFKTDKAYQKYLDEKAVKDILRDKAVLCVFDILTLEEWNNQKGTVKYEDRIAKVQALGAVSDSVFADSEKSPFPNRIQIVERFGVASLGEAQAIAQRWIASGVEGGILKASGHLYAFKRNRDWIKLKECTGEFEVQILELIKGDTKFNGDGTPMADMLGAFVVTDGTRKFKIGTGVLLSEDFRIYALANPTEFLEKIATASGQRKTETSVICPRIERMRPDRTSLENE